MFETGFDTAQAWLVDQGLSVPLATLLGRVALGLLVLFVSWLSGVIARRIVRRIITRLVEVTTTHWDDILLKHGVVDHLMRLVPALVLQILVRIPLHGLPDAIGPVQTAIHIYMLVVTLLVLDSALNAALAIYSHYPVSQRFELKSFVQVAKIIVYFIMGVLVVSQLLDTSPIAFFGGLGAMSAVMLLIFKDAILGFVAGIQLTANNMVRRGDWIEMPKYGADGDVLDIALTTVKVQNWDKTITTIPTYALISDSFKNWRGMDESGGRRIKRSLSIDMTTVKICDPAMIDRFRRFAYISGYIDGKQSELALWNAKQGTDDQELINGRRLTNLGTFRAYVTAYLKQHPQVHEGMTTMVRQLQPSDRGLPMEIYVFLKEQRWVEYEGIQADIFDHIIAVVQEFDLKVFQHPTGSDVSGLMDRASPGV